jgi:hypothetical protein
LVYLLFFPLLVSYTDWARSKKQCINHNHYHFSQVDFINSCSVFKWQSSKLQLPVLFCCGGLCTDGIQKHCMRKPLPCLLWGANTDERLRVADDVTFIHDEPKRSNNWYVSTHERKLTETALFISQNFFYTTIIQNVV